MPLAGLVEYIFIACHDKQIRLIFQKYFLDMSRSRLLVWKTCHKLWKPRCLRNDWISIPDDALDKPAAANFTYTTSISNARTSTECTCHRVLAASNELSYIHVVCLGIWSCPARTPWQVDPLTQVDRSCSNLCKGLTSDFKIFFTPKVYPGEPFHFNIRQYGLVRLLCIIFNPFKEPGASEMTTDRPVFFVQISISHFGMGNQCTSDGMPGQLCAVVNITKQGNLINNSAYSTSLRSTETQGYSN